MFPRNINSGPLTIHLYGLIIAIAVYLGWYLAKKRASAYKIPPKIFEDPILLIPLFLAILGARFYHVIDYWSMYQTNLISTLYITNGGLGIWGGLLGLFAGLLVVSIIKKLSLLSILDLCAPSVILAQAIGRFGNYINQEGFGPPTNLPWGIFIEKSNRPAQYITSGYFHPTFFYEAILNFIFFIILLKLSVKLKINGQIFVLYLIFYSTIRFITEFWRIDTWVIGTVKIAQVMSISVFIIGISISLILKKRYL
ncbi:prolipoprotein diacylglyceryl transferase [Candidatus Curtissbacteria bacterium RBG_13_35_7]|uniref:Phosphatidylglycerol--prolipoprotein diacylglyceryl transferase n=1 Tax=Candidatus Curtissbacteria bacterium RBG_13_35_7 TaxID=1797705 RepID=A0A1F5G4N6_9BACT|nr:MAG: prolipoprotein diacylglyceryl transferase [Candidatus Curtissbacteria bacterium RBG_13_35_7]